MTELTWLAHFVTKFKMSKDAKDEVLRRMEEIDKNQGNHAIYPQGTHAIYPQNPITNPHAQAASTLAIMQKHGIEPPTATSTTPIATTPVTQAAIMHRQELIDKALNGVEEKGRKSPRKW